MTTPLQVEVFEVLGYTAGVTEAASYSWTGTEPSAAIIAAVEALPADANTLYSITENHADDDLVEDLLEVVTTAQGDAFQMWQYEQYCAACERILLSTEGLLWQFFRTAYLRLSPDSYGMSTYITALEDANLTRPIMDGGLSADPIPEEEEEVE